VRNQSCGCAFESHEQEKLLGTKESMMFHEASSKTKATRRYIEVTRLPSQPTILRSQIMAQRSAMIGEQDEAQLNVMLARFV